MEGAGLGAVDRLTDTTSSWLPALANGDMFTHAFSPGFMVPPVVVGKPRIFISHGTQDQALEIDSTSWRLVP